MIVKALLKKIIPASCLLAYHKLFAIFASIRYGFPSRKLVVIGITGTKGKSTTAVMLARILEEAGHTVGSLNTIFFKVGNKEWPNKKKQSMLGRASLQKMLAKMVRAGCTHAVIEVTSEGIMQHRQWGISFDVAVFTNLEPEHIEAHGSFTKYREAKERLFTQLARSRKKTVRRVRVPKVIVVNADDRNHTHFLQHRADKKWLVYSSCDRAEKEKQKNHYILCAHNMKTTPDGSVFEINDTYIHLRVHGIVMAHNALLAIAAAKALGVTVSTSEQALERIHHIPGRSEILVAQNGARIIIDYAHEPYSFTAVFKLARELCPQGKVITVFGATGGGRDKHKRSRMGAIAAEYSGEVVLTTDDPYNDDPKKLIADIVPGIEKAQPAWSEGHEWWRVLDRKAAIKKAIARAGEKDIVLILGKGSEQTMAIGDGKYIPWNDKEVVESIIAE